jgi:molecular chaperone GrpE
MAANRTTGAADSSEVEPADAPLIDIVHEESNDRDAQLADCQDRLLRLQAEMENLRRRTAREVADERRYGGLPIVRDLLQALDNVDRAIEAGEKAADATSLLEGVRLVGRQLRSVLDKHDVKPIAAQGEVFDPNLHQAILQQPSDQPSGTVITVTQEGYQLYDRVVRPSQVIVSAGSGEGS